MLGPRKPLQPLRRRRVEGRPTARVVTAVQETAGAHIRVDSYVNIESVACWKIRSKPIGWTPPRLTTNDGCQSLLRSPEPEPEWRDRTRLESRKNRLS